MLEVQKLLVRAFHTMPDTLDTHLDDFYGVIKIENFLIPQRKPKNKPILANLPHHTGTTSSFKLSWHMSIIPKRFVGKKSFPHWHPVEMRSEGGTIINKLSFFFWITPITVTVLPSLINLHMNKKQHNMLNHNVNALLPLYNVNNWTYECYAKAYALL